MRLSCITDGLVGRFSGEVFTLTHRERSAKPMFGLCMNNKGKMTRFSRLRRSLPALCVGAAVIVGVLSARAFVKAQSFPRESQFTARRLNTDTREDILDRLRTSLSEDEKDVAVLKTRIREVDSRLRQIEALDMGVVKMRLTNVEESNKDDRIERLSLRTAMLTTFGGMIVVLFSSWWSRRNGVKS